MNKILTGISFLSISSLIGLGLFKNLEDINKNPKKYQDGLNNLKENFQKMNPFTLSNNTMEKDNVLYLYDQTDDKE